MACAGSGEAGDPAGRSSSTTARRTPATCSPGCGRCRRPRPAAHRVRPARLRRLDAPAGPDRGRLPDLVTAAALTGEFAEYLAYTGREGLAPGAQGWWDDGEAFGRPWGSELSATEVPVLLMHGRQDQFVPFGHGQWLAARVPGVDARLLDDDGHITLITERIGEVHAWLAQRS